MSVLGARGVAPARRPDFDGLADRPAGRIAASPSAAGELGELLRLAVEQIPALSAAGPAVERVWRHNPESIWAFRRGERIVGAYAMLFLNAAGHRRLRAGAFDGANPTLAQLAGPGEPVAAIYKWAVVAPGLAAAGIRIVSRHLSAPPYAAADLYARATTESATRLMLNLGFRPIVETDPKLLCSGSIRIGLVNLNSRIEAAI